MTHEKPINFFQHALDNMADRGASREDVELTIRTGECIPAKKGRISFRKNFGYNALWKNKFYQVKQVMPIVAEETDRLVVIVTVYSIFYWRHKMKIKYDSEVDAAYISFKKGPTEVTTLRLSEDIAIDLGPNDQIVGIEILDASEHLDFKKGRPEVELENIKVA